MEEQNAVLPRSKTRLVVGIIVWVVWIAGLLALAGLSSNPITLNRRQFADADLVIIGNVADSSTGRVSVAETMYGIFPEKELTVVGLSEISNLSAGNSYVMPLKRLNGEFDVVAITKDERGRVVYPATSEVRSQLDNVLVEISKRLTP
ncbi:hypothetical protein CA54_06650 [Symmachiella macrocystis]|uniref:Uncharacterized protein n=2 Tax=Symmachiella macrocystis TaxID=2527985 RepID=A0A5C6BI45_9PLAN|nr:hypothetical protein CA54_06650 [Symmachiella macrocystis]